jgi:hypothetical protein
MKRIISLLALTLAFAAHADKPLVNERIVFNWHNFLSGCSTWNLADWNRWTDDAQQLGYNAIMVHAYGNNPMAGFTFQGTPKPVGYLSTTVKGRDWSTMHVNDVRRLFGGEVFEGGTGILPVSGPATHGQDGHATVFGADAGMVPDERRVAAAQALMQGVFAHAAQRGMGVVFAVDVDTPSANPPELISLLPESARFKADGIWLPNPDTPEGDAFFRAQVGGLMKTYPQITKLVVWFRRGGTPWMNLRVSDLPPVWQKEFADKIARAPATEKEWKAPGLFAISKIVRAFDRALKECGAKQTRLAAGTWGFEFLSAADRFFPKDVALIGLDYDVLHEKPQLGTAESRAPLREVGAHRPVIPIIWAHHDDGHYIGRPYTPFSEFYSKLADANASGFGVIHWTTRPLDLFFASHARQVFEKTKDEPLRATCEQVGGKTLGEYLYRWVTEAPRFGRETSDHFIDRPLTNAAAVVAGCRERLALLDKCGAGLQPAKPSRTDGQVANLLHIDYFRGLEEFIAAFYQTHEQFQNAETLWKKGDLAGARAVMANCRPEPVIEQFAKFSSIGGITRGEQGLVVSLNTRWLVYFVRLRQALGLEPVRYNFAPTSHDKLAQAAGRFTYYFDADHRVWQTLGAEETGAELFSAASASDEIARHGLESDKPITLTLRPIVHKAPLPAGKYRLRLLAADPSSTAAGQRVFAVQMKATGAAGGPVRYSFAPTRAKFVRLLCRGNSVNDWSSIVEVASPALAGGASASTSVKECEAVHAIDRRANTRWAARGDNVWIQFPLKTETALEQLDVTWHLGEQRQYRVEFLVSDDGTNWRKLAAQAGSVAEPVSDRVDLFARAGGAKRPVELVYPINLAVPGVVELRLVPVTGKALLCGVVLEPDK